jgi:hypothetical protein
MTATAEQGWARAVGAGSKMSGTYKDPSLSAAPARATSTAFTEIPSRVGSQLRYRNGRVTDLQGRQIQPAHQPVERQAMAVAFPPTLSAAPTKPRLQPSPLSTMAHPSLPPTVVVSKKAAGYAPQSKSIAARAIAYLQGQPANAYLTADRLVTEFGMSRSSYHGLFQSAWAKKALLRITVDGRGAIALPHYQSLDSLPAPHTDSPAEVVSHSAPPPVTHLPGRLFINGPAGFTASLWADGELEIEGLKAGTEGPFRFSHPQTCMLAELLHGYSVDSEFPL